MKNLVLILILPLFIGCSKNDNEPQDYREDFTGNYNCSYLKTLSTYYQDSIWVDTICFSNDTVITIHKAVDKNEIVFLDWNLRIQESGKIDTGYCIFSDCIDCDTYPLVFSKDSIYYFTQCGGHGSFYEYDLSGIKIK